MPPAECRFPVLLQTLGPMLLAVRYVRKAAIGIGFSPATLAKTGRCSPASISVSNHPGSQNLSRLQIVPLRMTMSLPVLSAGMKKPPASEMRGGRGYIVTVTTISLLTIRLLLSTSRWN